MEQGEYIIRPMVYRFLVPSLVHILMRLEIPKDIAYMLVIGLSFIGFLVTMAHLYAEFGNKDNMWVVSFVSSWGLLFLTYIYSKSYDIATAFFMTLSALLIYRDKTLILMLIFPFICANRETAFLVTILWGMWYWNKVSLFRWVYVVGYQVFMFVLIQTATKIYYADLPTYSRFNILSNLEVFRNYWLVTLILFGAFGLIMYVIYSGWISKPLFLRSSYLAIAPIVFCLYLVFGASFEIRVFAEIYPLTVLLTLPKSVL